MVQIPTVTTERLILRAFRDDDLDACAEMCADPEVMRYLGEGKTLSRADAWRQLAFFMGHWELRGFGLWALEERASGRFLGRAGLLQPEGWPGFEVGWTGTRVVGKGLRHRGGARGAAVRVRRAGPRPRDQHQPPGQPAVHPRRRAPGRAAGGEAESFFGSP